MEENNIFIRLKDIKKCFGEKKVLDNINLEIKKGEIIGIVGESGSGKTTLLKTIIGFLKPDEGDLFLKQKLISKQSSILFKSDHFRSFGFSTQEKSFYSKLTIRENLIYFGALHEISKIKIDKKIDEVLMQVNLIKEKNTVARDLSQGMQKRLDIACSIIHDPEILIVDEPTADLDPGLRNQMWGLIKDLNSKSNKTIIISSHIPKDLFPICNRMFLLQESKLKQINKSIQLSKIYNFSNENK